MPEELDRSSTTRSRASSLVSTRCCECYVRICAVPAVPNPRLPLEPPARVHAAARVKPCLRPHISCISGWPHMSRNADAVCFPHRQSPVPPPGYTSHLVNTRRHTATPPLRTHPTTAPAPSSSSSKRGRRPRSTRRSSTSMRASCTRLSVGESVSGAGSSHSGCATNRL